MKLPHWVKVLGFVIIALFVSQPAFPSLAKTGEPLHPIHISNAAVHYNPTTGDLEISIKIYSDDLETEIRPEGFAPLNIGLENEHAATDSLLLAYLAEQFVLHNRSYQLPIMYVGREQKEEATWIYLVSPDYQESESMIVHYAVLMGLYSDQKNIFSWTIGEQKQSLLFTKKNPTQEMTL
jgi:hypothetical protein